MIAARGDREKDTICAVSTPSGHGGISVIRISGENALAQAQKLCAFLPEKPQSHKAYYGILKKSLDQIEVDDVLATFFQKGHSYTGEETIEISCHGNPLLTQLILKEFISLGARAADKGEFTYRAFMNGKIDLAQAEGVLTLIQGQSEQTTRQSLRQLKGQLSEDLTHIEDTIIWCLAHIEASIDFSTENLEIVSDEVLTSKMHQVLVLVQKLLNSYQVGRVIKDGFQVVIIGSPNVGKSSLLNLLAQEDRAIVTDVPGTTRDTLEVSQFIKGYKVNFVDTAGIRETADQVEKIGIQRTYKAVQEADLVIFVYDSNKELSSEEIVEIKKLQNQEVLFIANKSDLNQSSLAEVTQSLALQLAPIKTEFFTNKVVLFSCKKPTDGNNVQEHVAKYLENYQLEDQAVIIHARHFENLKKAQVNLLEAKQVFENTKAYELVAFELKESLLAVQEILGKRFDDDILDRVFKEFCLGK